MDCSSPSVHLDDEAVPACMHVAEPERKQGGEMGGQFIYYWTFGVDAETAWKCAPLERLFGCLQQSLTSIASKPSMPIFAGHAVHQQLGYHTCSARLEASARLSPPPACIRLACPATPVVAATARLAGTACS